jgi:hypothetical protein
MPRWCVGTNNFFRGVRQRDVIELDERGFCAAQTGDEIEQRRFARAGRAENGRDAAADFDIHFEREGRERQRNFFQQQVHFFSGAAKIR